MVYSMKIDILSLFPESFDFLRTYGVIGRAIEKGLLDIQATNIRDFSKNKHKKVDDTVYGGAAGMLMTAQPIVDAIEDKKTENSKIIYLSPQGKLFDQEKAIELSKQEHLILLCGHYEGIDQRVSNFYVDEEVSIGDYILTGGEIPAMVLIDASVRWIDGVLGNDESAPTDSHYNGLLQHDEYTKPRDFRGHRVPDVLLSGNHQLIDQWRKENSINKTKRVRPDLYKRYMDENNDS